MWWISCTMAGKRISKTAIDWIALSEKIKPSTQDSFKSFRTKHESFLKAVSGRPGELPQINFDLYKSQLPNKQFVDEMQKLYSTVAVTYPKAPKAILDQLKQKKVDRAQDQADYKKYLNYKIEEMKYFRSVIDKLPPPEEMTTEMLAHYFPDSVKSISYVKKNQPIFPFTPDKPNE
ncbi:hypothetical protein KUTeg_003515 [Tegillarca granosa]|uniref:ATP synthase subunit d, mitochondrial n=1 Tax=Tegillarca granosa TaxID=220873 RepID=A0ABQ9FMB5_TEGGR|nr:hypothetical protein KUTeg_003515 [Tegillarca granosa]